MLAFTCMNGADGDPAHETERVCCGERGEERPPGWPKLMGSYAAEAVTAGSGGSVPNIQEAEAWMSRLAGGREVAETEPGVYRHTDITGYGYRVFELTSLLPGTGFAVHVTKIREQDEAGMGR